MEMRYNHYKEVESEHYDQQLRTLTKIFTKKGYTNIRFENLIQTEEDLKCGIDVKLIANKNDKEVEIPIGLRSRDNCAFRDLTIRYQASIYNPPTEYHKILDGSYAARLIFYTWHIDANPKYINYILVKVSEVKKVLENSNINKMIIPNTDDNSKLMQIDLKHLNLLEQCVDKYFLN